MNGYIKANILGKERGLKFGLLAMQNISSDIEKYKQFGTDNTMTLTSIIYWGMVNNCLQKREDPDFSFEDVCDWVDSNIDQAELFESIAKAFEDNSILKSLDEKKTKLTPKQKTAGKK